MNINKKILSDRVKEVSIETGHSYHSLASEFGVTQKTFNKWAQGEIPQWRLKSFCEFLDIDYRDVLEDE